MMTIKVNNSLILEKNHMSTNCSYAQLSGIYFNKEGFHEATNTKLETEKYNPDKYMKAKESVTNNGSFVEYDRKVKSDNKQKKTSIVIQATKRTAKKESYEDLLKVPNTAKQKVKDCGDIISKPVLKKEKEISDMLKPTKIYTKPKKVVQQPVVEDKPGYNTISNTVPVEETPKEPTEVLTTAQIVESNNNTEEQAVTQTTINQQYAMAQIPVYKAPNEMPIVPNKEVAMVIKKSTSTAKYKPGDGTLALNGWVKFRNGRLRPNNFGDDINFSFLSEITGYRHVLYTNAYALRSKNFTMIGSIFIDRYINRNTVVWGSGMLRPKTLLNKPLQVCAVRGPKTREIVLQSGIPCPEIYGDPALLIPYYYHPYVMKKYKIGIIPHHSNINNPILDKFKNSNDKITVIDFTCYTDWKDIIKEINSCTFIVSESLHGLIISEAYRIPNIWISFTDIDQDFKYEDFFLSIGKTPYSPYLVTDKTTVLDFMKLRSQYDPTFNIDLKKLVNACPIELKNINLANKIKPYTGKTMVCCIAKLENKYIREFVQHYKALGFDNICLYDNNDPDGERFEDVISEYIKSGFVIVKDVRGQALAQIPAYTECYNTYKDKYDWIAFFDVDEFLNLDKGMKIKEFLSKDIYNDRGINAIRICWKQFTDSGLIKCDNNYSVKKYTEYIPLTLINTALTKLILKTSLDNVEFSSPHGPLTNPDIVCVNTAGDLCKNSILILNRSWANALLNHYRFRTIEEYVLNKMVRLWPTNYKQGGKTGLNLDLFFKFNKKTSEKEQYANYLLDKYNISRNE